MQDFLSGLKKGIPIALGYITVSFAFGVYATNGGISPLVAIVISMTNLTSSGQFAGVNLIIQAASYLEIALTVFLINLRYSLMSISLTQKLSVEISTSKRLIMGFGITDEIFVLASQKEDKISFSFMIGLILLPFLGWTSGTALGAFSSDLLNDNLQNAMGIALYAMFIAIFIPDAKKSKPIFFVLIFGVAFSLILYYVPFLKDISFGFRIIISTILASILGAVLFPIKEAKSDVSDN